MYGSIGADRSSLLIEGFIRRKRKEKKKRCRNPSSTHQVLNTGLPRYRFFNRRNDDYPRYGFYGIQDLKMRMKSEDTGTSPISFQS
jgi:hypothetical protein